YTEDPNGMLVEFTVDVPNSSEISKTRKNTAHKDLEKWLAGDHTSNNVYR
ncbi:MAG: VOC family protein, partial [Actinobacteria bacterium]|nr:VOC family protein [Actinomycetota bacterium]